MEDHNTESSYAFPIEWHIPENIKPQFVTNLTVQHTGQEFIISFYETYPPLVIGTSEEVEARLEQIESVRAECIARFVMTPGRMENFVQALQTNYEKYVANFGEPKSKA
jgi:hypothetical protein